LKHPNIIGFVSAWIHRQKSEIIFVTECVTGGSLKKYLKKIKKPRLKIIKKWCKEILKGLIYLHTYKPYPIIHRDIKCENIFVNSNTNDIRIGDLGLALTMSKTQTWSVIGNYPSNNLFRNP
jgi:WNK lysine deficient protein kinase